MTTRPPVPNSAAPHGARPIWLVRRSQLTMIRNPRGGGPQSQREQAVRFWTLILKRLRDYVHPPNGVEHD